MLTRLILAHTSKLKVLFVKLIFKCNQANQRGPLALSAPSGALYAIMRLYRHGKQLFEIFMQPKTSVTILAPNHYYMINATQGIQSTLWVHSANT